MHLDEIIPTPKSPNEKFQFENQNLEFSIVDFWQWNQSDLIENRNRGILAEFIVKKALNLQSETRLEWANYDFETEDTIKIEVKSAAYVQAWKQKKPSAISFDISLKRALQPDNNYANEAKRQADIYIFCLLHHQGEGEVNPMDLNQWTFYIVTTAALNQHYPNYKTIGLWYLDRIGAEGCGYGQIKEKFDRAAKQIVKGQLV